MATRLADGSILMADGRILYANSLVLAQDFPELVILLGPPPAWPFSGGGGGGGGNGVIGEDGAQGFQGPGGAAGGPQGNQGNQGIAGTAGAGGVQGNQGNQGFTGSGAQGNQGNQGVAGTAGAAGAQGNQGNQGLTGSGAQGAQGTAGPGNGWTDDGTTVRLTTSADEVVVGGVMALGKFGVLGDTPTQILVAFQLAPGSSDPFLRLQSSAGLLQSEFDFSGNYSIFATAGDANPTTSLRSGALLFGPGGASVLDVSLRRRGASQLTVTDAAGAVTGQFVPLTDNTGNIGNNTLRWGEVSSVQFNVYVTTGDTNPSARLSNGALLFGPGGGSVLDVSLRRRGASQLTVTDAAGAVAGSFVPFTDNAGNVGNNTLRWSEVSAVQFNVYATVGDVNPTVRLSTGALSFGPGGGSALDASLRRMAASRFTVANAAGTVTGELTPLVDNAGSIGISTLQWSQMNSRLFKMGELGADPASEANIGQLYTKDVAGVTQLFFARDNGTVIQLT